MRSSLACALFLLALTLGGCSLPAPYETYPPSAPPPPPPRAPNALTSAGPITTTPDNEMDFGEPQATSAAQAQSPPAESGKGRQVAICYSRLWNSAAAVRSAAQQACGSKTAPRLVSQDTDLDACPVLTPSHAVYACGAP